jgi:hypothetical protein
MPRIPYKVFRRSENTNSFGLYGMWLVGIFGDAWEVAANNLNAKPIGEVIGVNVDDHGNPDWASKGFEIPELKAQMPKEVFDEVWPDAERGLAYRAEMTAAGLEWENFIGCWRKSLNDRQYTLYYDQHGDWYPHSMAEPCSIRCEDNEGEEKYQKPFHTVRAALAYIAEQKDADLAVTAPVIEPEFKD